MINYNNDPDWDPYNQDDFDFTEIDDGDYNMYREQKQIDKLNGKLTQSGFYSTLQ